MSTTNPETEAIDAETPDSKSAPVHRIVHTPGPWGIAVWAEHHKLAGQASSVHSEDENDDDLETICDMDKWTEPREKMANARLIAAAPDLLEALEESLSLNINWSETAEQEHLRHLSEYKRVIEQARAAIEKATNVV